MKDSGICDCNFLRLLASIFYCLSNKLCFTRCNSFELGGRVHLAWIQQQHLQCGHLCGENEGFCFGM
ncbi:5-amino-6-(D-ribitylamino)uracil--L-tyrosine 4-hydroxyphenyl transferase [Trichinella spiralis]|uniref:5-amino-6-(D-ribitylamino)uracil--L-tyrosine 4-hydroxyphenyl transferase n=1 Tax=Trichinella spiralis TaxID=6334 RepID=A0ABR3K6K9_TRISP